MKYETSPGNFPEPFVIKGALPNFVSLHPATTPYEDVEALDRSIETRLNNIQGFNASLNDLTGNIYRSLVVTAASFRSRNLDRGTSWINRNSRAVSWKSIEEDYADPNRHFGNEYRFNLHFNTVKTPDGQTRIASVRKYRQQYFEGPYTNQQVAENPNLKGAKIPSFTRPLYILDLEADEQEIKKVKFCWDSDTQDRLFARGNTGEPLRRPFYENLGLKWIDKHIYGGSQSFLEFILTAESTHMDFRLGVGEDYYTSVATYDPDKDAFLIKRDKRHWAATNRKAIPAEDALITLGLILDLLPKE